MPNSKRQEKGGFQLADFVTRTASISAEKQRIIEQKLIEYNRDPADARARIAKEKLGILSKLINYFSKKDEND